MAIDKKTHRIYTSAVIPGENNQKSFGVLVLEKN